MHSAHALSVDLFFFYFHFVASPPLNFWRQNHTHSQSVSSRSFFFQFTTRRRIPMPILMNILIMVLVCLVFFLFGRPKEKNAYTCITVSIAVTIHLLLISTCMWSRLFKLTACSTLRTLPIPIAIAHALIHYHSTQSAIVRIDCDIVWEKWKIHFF